MAEGETPKEASVATATPETATAVVEAVPEQIEPSVVELSPPVPVEAERPEDAKLSRQQRILAKADEVRAAKKAAKDAIAKRAAMEDELVKLKREEAQAVHQAKQQADQFHRMVMEDGE